ncbi:hypothetical protein [Desulfobulbus sp.]|uniref:hypothetical protein n=1 Tax=Desulfobulbus sp. TaxID=895 RepID=UPI00286F39C5|nr:hypothetical protein [Desulfobulbus sp.]
MSSTPGRAIQAASGPVPPDQVLLEEQSRRDGLQNQARPLTLTEKLELAGLLAAAGIRRLQVGSFVDPRRVPQMAGTEELAVRVRTYWPHLTCSALVLNARGLAHALALRHAPSQPVGFDERGPQSAQRGPRRGQGPG